MIENRKLFANKLVSTVVPSTMPYDQQLMAYQSVQEVADTIVPKRLYRFRSCNERNLSAFDRNELWASTADCMNDGFDTRLYYDTNAVEEWRNRLLSEDIKQKTFLNSIIITPDMPPQLQQVKEALAALPKESFNQITTQVKQFIADKSVVSEQLLPSIAQQTIKFCCFSESINSPYMWGMYAGEETGFALEYDLSDYSSITAPTSGKTRNCFVYPVFYSDQRFQVPTDYIFYLFKHRITNMALLFTGVWNNYPIFAQQVLSSVICPDLSLATKVSLHKSDEWEKETEWRLFCSSMDDPEFINSRHGCCIKKPSELYLGRHISGINEKILRNLAKEKNIPVHKMRLDDCSPRYDLVVI